MFLPIRSKNPPDSFPYVTCALILINVVVHVLATHGSMVLPILVAKQYGVIPANPQPADFLSSMFLHGSFLHLLGNMWFLYLFGFAVEGRLRSLKFTALYLVSGLCGAMLHVVVMGPSRPEVPLIGASGAIMGVVGAAMIIFPYAQIDFAYFWLGRAFHGETPWGVVSWPMWGVALMYLFLDLFNGFLFGKFAGTAHFAHVGGLLIGAVFVLILRVKRDSEATSEAKATVSATKDYTSLHRMELRALADAQPEDPFIALHWMHRLVQDGRTDPTAKANFLRALPQLMKPEMLASVATILESMAGDPDVKPPMIMRIALTLEQQANPRLAEKMYDLVARHPLASGEDWDMAIYRIGLINENSSFNNQKALECYQVLVSQSPDSPLAAQAQPRIARLRSRTPVKA